MREIASAAKEGYDEAALKTVEHLLYHYAKGIGSIINLLDPDCIVIGGGVGQVDDLFSKGPDLVRRFVYNDRLDTLILRPKLGDSAGVFGAALL